MNKPKTYLTRIIMIVAALALAGCAETGNRDGTDGADGIDGQNGTDGDNGDNGDNGDAGKTGPDGDDGMDGDNGTNAGDFSFRSDAPDEYLRIDRMGMPAVATALIPADNKDAYNYDGPEGDVAGNWVSDIVASVAFFHGALDGQLQSLGLTVCEVADCVATAAPLVVPDTISIDVTADAGFPNGRALEDQSIDITLAVVLLDLNTHPVTLLADLPLNPPANDKEFMAQFPYLAPPH